MWHPGGDHRVGIARREPALADDDPRGALETLFDLAAVAELLLPGGARRLEPVEQPEQVGVERSHAPERDRLAEQHAPRPAVQRDAVRSEGQLRGAERTIARRRDLLRAATPRDRPRTP